MAEGKSDYGHEYLNGPGFHLDGWGAGPFILQAGSSTFYFEDSDRFGPVPLRKDGEVRANPFFGEKSPFWRAWEKWVAGGRQLAEDGRTCLLGGAVG